MCSSHLNPSGHSDLWNWLSLSLNPNPTAPLSKHSTNLSRASPSWLTGVPKRVPAVLLCRVGRNIRTRSNGNRSALAIVEYQNTHRNIKKEGMKLTLNCEHQKSLHLPVTATCYFGPFQSPPWPLSCSLWGAYRHAACPAVVSDPMDRGLSL